MAELVLKVGAGAGYEEGDIIAAFNRRRIRCVHAQMICDVRKFGTNTDGLRPDGLAKIFRESCCQFRFERISHTEVRRTIIVSGKSEVFGPVPNGNGEYIDVPEFVRRRLKHRGHALFGTQGNEIWYGGRSDFSNAAMDKVWTAIEAKTPLREADHALWPLGVDDKKYHFAVSVTEFDDDRAEELVSPVLENAGTDDEVVVKKRARMVPWRSGLGLSPEVLSRIEDRSDSLDHRSRSRFDHLAVVQEKR